jgi:uncharacterized protein YcbK (DUF882 family)
MFDRTEKDTEIALSRRSFLTGIVGGAIVLNAPGLNAKVLTGPDRQLSLYNTHTGEKLTAAFWSEGKYLDDGLEEINWLLRDHRANKASTIDTSLLDLLYRLQARIGHPGEFQVISGYRSPETNKMLRNNSSGVAKRSYHMLGQAIDVRLPGFDTRELKKAAIAMQAGGVGYYSSSDFVHLDVGRVRTW